MTTLHDVSYNQHIRHASFDITNMYTNIPTTNIPQIPWYAINRIYQKGSNEK
jgi:hypothetical protein